MHAILVLCLVSLSAFSVVPSVTLASHEAANTPINNWEFSLLMAPTQEDEIQTDITSVDYPERVLVNDEFFVRVTIHYRFPSPPSYAYIGWELAAWIVDRDTGDVISKDKMYPPPGGAGEGEFTSHNDLQAPRQSKVWRLAAFATFTLAPEPYGGADWYYHEKSEWRRDFDVRAITISEASELRTAQIVSIESANEVFGGDYFGAKVTIAYGSFFHMSQMRVGIRDPSMGQTIPSPLEGSSSLWTPLAEHDSESMSTAGKVITRTYNFTLRATNVTEGIWEGGREAGTWRLSAFVSYVEMDREYGKISEGVVEEPFQVEVKDVNDYYSVKIISVNHPSFVLPEQEFTIDVTIEYSLASSVPIKIYAYSLGRLLGELEPKFQQPEHPVATGEEEYVGNGTIRGYWRYTAPKAAVFRQWLSYGGEDTMTIEIVVEAHVRRDNPLVWVGDRSAVAIKIWNITMNEIAIYVGSGVLMSAIVATLFTLHRRGKLRAPTLSLRITRFCVNCGRNLSSMPSDIKNCPYCQSPLEG